MSIFKNSSIINIISCINYPRINQNIQNKLNEILSYVYKVDIELGLKIRNLLKKIFNDEMLSNSKNLTDLFTEAYSKVGKKTIELI